MASSATDYPSSSGHVQHPSGPHSPPEAPCWFSDSSAGGAARAAESSTPSADQHVAAALRSWRPRSQAASFASAPLRPLAGLAPRWETTGQATAGLNPSGSGPFHPLRRIPRCRRHRRYRGSSSAGQRRASSPVRPIPMRPNIGRPPSGLGLTFPPLSALTRPSPELPTHPMLA